MSSTPYRAMTVRQFFDAYYLPVVVDPDATLNYKQQLLRSITLWEQSTGDPSLRSITAVMFAHFRDALTARANLGGRSWSPNTVRTRLAHVRRILGAAGPPGPRNPHGLGVLRIVPWARPPRAKSKPIRIVSDDTIAKVYAACVWMVRPRLPEVKAVWWWRAALVIFSCTGIRRGTLLAMQWADVDLDHRRLVLPAERMKTRRELVLPLPDVAMQHLAKIRTHDPMVFPWPYHSRTFDADFQRLRYMAGLKPDEHFGCHDLRRTVASKLCRCAGIDTARLVLGHTSDVVTLGHYVQPDATVADGLAKLPLPAAFALVAE